MPDHSKFELRISVEDFADVSCRGIGPAREISIVGSEVDPTQYDAAIAEQRRDDIVPVCRRNVIGRDSRHRLRARTGRTLVSKTDVPQFIYRLTGSNHSKFL